MDLKAIQAALLFGGQSGPGGDWAEAVCAPFTASGGRSLQPTGRAAF